MHRSMAIVIVLFVAALPAPAAETLQTDGWQYVVVQDGGRYKPLDTLAHIANFLLSQCADVRHEELSN